MIHYLTGGSRNDPAKYYGQAVIDCKLDDNKLYLRLDSGVKIAIWDDGQSCCENRYMTTDDDIRSLIGGKLMRIESKEGPETEGWLLSTSDAADDMPGVHLGGGRIMKKKNQKTTDKKTK